MCSGLNYGFNPTGLQTSADFFFQTFNLFNDAANMDIRHGLQTMKETAIMENISYLEIQNQIANTVPIANSSAYVVAMRKIQVTKQ